MQQNGCRLQAQPNGFRKMLENENMILTPSWLICVAQNAIAEAAPRFTLSFLWSSKRSQLEPT